MRPWSWRGCSSSSSYSSSSSLVVLVLLLFWERGVLGLEALVEEGLRRGKVEKGVLVEEVRRRRGRGVLLLLGFVMREEWAAVIFRVMVAEGLGVYDGLELDGWRTVASFGMEGESVIIAPRRVSFQCCLLLHARERRRKKL